MSCKQTDNRNTTKNMLECVAQIIASVLPMLFYGIDSINRCRKLEAIINYGYMIYKSMTLLDYYFSCGTMCAHSLLERQLLFFYHNVC